MVDINDDWGFCSTQSKNRKIKGKKVNGDDFESSSNLPIAQLNIQDGSSYSSNQMGGNFGGGGASGSW